MRRLCLPLPEAREEVAWVGVRWRVGTRTFAHLLAIESGWPPAYARAAASDGPCSVLMVRSAGQELDVLRRIGHPFFPTPWRSDEVGVHLTDATEWAEVAELVTESYRTVAPRRLAAAVRLPPQQD